MRPLGTGPLLGLLVVAIGLLPSARAHIYLVNDRTPLHDNRDGSVDIYIQPGPPRIASQRRDWLPSPAGKPFRLIVRLCEPIDPGGIISGSSWEPPTVLPCLPSGLTAAGTACAS